MSFCNLSLYESNLISPQDRMDSVAHTESDLIVPQGHVTLDQNRGGYINQANEKPAVTRRGGQNKYLT